ncbi:MAG TPA: hypothetical protein VGL53_08030 [Bryobacteraceae bacterium]
MRLFVAIAAAVLAYLAFGPVIVSALWLIVPAVLFVGLMILHLRIDKRRQFAGRAVRYYEQGLKRLSDEWAGSGNFGDAFADPTHPYAGDLDLFGRGSLFELISTARTYEGEATLASWLKYPATREEARLRQGAVRELMPNVDQRETLMLLGEEIRSEVQAKPLADWAAAPPTPYFPGAPIVAFLFAVTAVAAFGGYWAGRWGSSVFLIAFFAGQLFAVAFFQKTRFILSNLHARAHDLTLLSSLLAEVEKATFTSEKLKSIQASIQFNGKPASARIAQLDRLLSLHENGSNQYVFPIALVLLWHTQLAMAVETWRAENGPHIAKWLAALGEFEALSSFACYAFENPHSIEPELIAEPIVTAVGLGHPLLPERSCVTNDVSLGGAIKLLVVSGSNMSGKSTLLRSIGLNIVLAWAGARVRAASLSTGPVALGASLRTVDSLQKGRSRFYAEITRLRQIADLAKGERPLLFLLDELLSGTNSHDRRIGAQSIVEGLLKRGAIGLVTTHDLALAEIGKTLGAIAVNVHFEDHLENGEIRFDYKMRPGVVERSNALELMRAVGLLED